MDLDYLLHREQAELLMARQSICPKGRWVHLQLAAAYGSSARSQNGRDPGKALGSTLYIWPKPQATAA